MVTVRDYQPDDLDECVALYIRVFSEPPWEEAWDPPDARAHLEQILLTPGSLGLVALEDGQIIGMLLGVEKRTSTGGAFIVDDVFVEGTKQRHRIGSELMTALKGSLRARGVPTIGLFTSWTAPASEFYRKQGFVEIPQLRFLRYDLDDEEAQ
jgi:ribosomal protein S18 acetylase RimI-like enzyme